MVDRGGGGFSLKHGVRGCSKVLGAFSSILVYRWGGFEIVPGTLMTPYFCDGMTMGCFADENDNKSSFQ